MSENLGSFEEKEPVKREAPPVGGHRHKLEFALLAAGIPLVILAFVFGMYASQQMRGDEVVIEDDKNVVVDPVDEEVEATPIDEIEYDDIEVVTGQHALTIDWVPVREQQTTEMNGVLLNATYTQAEQENFNENFGPKVFVLGTVKGGKYDGYRLTQEIAALSGLGTFYRTNYVLTNGDGQAVILDKYATSVSGAFSGPRTFVSAREVMGEQVLAKIGDELTFDSGAVIAEFEPAEKVYDGSGNAYRFIGFWNRVNYPSEIDLSSLVDHGSLEDGRALLAVEDFSDLGVNFKHLFTTVQKDGRLAIYDLELEIWPDAMEQIAVPQIRWNGGAYNRSEYMKGQLGGCGFSSAVNVVNRSDLPALKVIGSASAEGSDILGPEAYTDEYYDFAYKTWAGSDASKTRSAFAAIHPFFYYEDSLGRLIEFRHSETLPAVECGKPVIYLYPEEKTDMTVEVAPKGGFSVTIPEYNDGWNVTAYPDGRLMNHDDGKAYPYLFWEGRGGLYSAPEKYWVVAKEDVQSFLTSTLYDLGMNRVETSDFLEFWLPRMQSAPYYKIGFHGTEVMDMIAPLSISESPDTIVRILMDYDELQSPIPANPPTLPVRPERNGFTVIEWGGVLK